MISIIQNAQECLTVQEELNVKVGDEVLYCSSPFYGYEVIATVIKITPTGRIRINKTDSQFDKYGNQMGECSFYGRGHIYLLTEEKREHLFQENEISKCKRIFEKMKNNLTYAQAKDILNILSGGNKNG